MTISWFRFRRSRTALFNSVYTGDIESDSNLKLNESGRSARYRDAPNMVIRSCSAELGMLRRKGVDMGGRWDARKINTVKYFDVTTERSKGWNACT